LLIWGSAAAPVGLGECKQDACTTLGGGRECVCFFGECKQDACTTLGGGRECVCFFGECKQDACTTLGGRAGVCLLL
jgi:hypothetical protein